MKDMRVLVERDSVCMGDDCTAPNSKYILFESGISLSSLLSQIAQYVPDYSGSSIPFGESSITEFLLLFLSVMNITNANVYWHTMIYRQTS